VRFGNPVNISEKVNNLTLNLS